MKSLVNEFEAWLSSTVEVSHASNYFSHLFKDGCKFTLCDSCIGNQLNKLAVFFFLKLKVTVNCCYGIVKY